MAGSVVPLLALDHLVLAARTLAQGLDWCEATLGVRPDAGGRHALMGTHNRVFAIASAGFPRAYFEIIAIDPDAPAPPYARWFDLDDAALQRALVRGPQLVHWVARCESIAAARAVLLAGGIDGGEPQQAERMTPQGLLRWRIGVRADGHRPLGGAAPALIEWGDRHPTDSMPASGVTLQSMRVAGWPAALTVALPAAVERDLRTGAPPISVTLAGARGVVSLETPYLEA
jgi:hypothetical protein